MMKLSIMVEVLPIYLVTLFFKTYFSRFGSFEIFKTLDPTTGRGGPSIGRKDILEQLLDYTVKTFYSEVCTFYYSPYSGKRYMYQLSNS